MSSPHQYIGQELELFASAGNWKSYLKRTIQPYLKGSVLEVGAGLGATTRALNDGSCTSWLMLEPDLNMYHKLKENVATFPANTQAMSGTIRDVRGSYDVVLYIDVLEHIANDKDELNKAAAKLNSNGHLIVLAPAYNFLFSPFDQVIGHYRRYTKRSLIAAAPESMNLQKAHYLDALGFWASLANKCLLQQRLPTQKQISFWDRFLVPLSMRADRFVFHKFGKSVLVVWQAT